MTSEQIKIRIKRSGKGKGAIYDEIEFLNDLNLEDKKIPPQCYQRQGGTSEYWNRSNKSTYR